MKTWKMLTMLVVVVCVLACSTGCDFNNVANVLERAPDYLSDGLVELRLLAIQLQDGLAALIGGG